MSYEQSMPTQALGKQIEKKQIDRKLAKITVGQIFRVGHGLHGQR